MRTHKNLHLGRYAWTMMLTGALFFTSCTEDTILEEHQIETSGEGIYFGLPETNNSWEPDSRSAKKGDKFVMRSEESTDTLCVSTSTINGIHTSNDVQSRGARKNDLVESGFNVTAYYYPSGASTPSSILFNEDVTVANDGSTGMTTTYYWPKEGGFTFLATANGDNITIIDENNDGDFVTTPSLFYTVPDEVSYQKDAMVAFTGTTTINNNNNGAAVPLTFTHLCAAVQFQLTSEVENTIESIVISGVKGGTLTYTYSNGVWTPSNPTDDNVSYTINTTQDGTTITSDNDGTTLLLAPQTLTTDATITVNFSDGRAPVSTEANALTDNVWEMGKTFIYKLTITPEYTLEFIKEEGGHPLQDAHYVMDEVSIYVDPKLTTGWTVTSSDASVTLNTAKTELQEKGYWTEYMYTHDDQTIRTNSISGTTTGYVTIYVFWPENTTEDNRDITLTLTAADTDINDTYELTQLCPSWYNSSYGCERLEGKSNIWGLSWGNDFTVTYDLTQCSTSDRQNISRQIRWIKLLGSLLPWWFTEDYSYIDHDYSGGFLGTGIGSKTDKITINFGELMSDGAANSIASSTTDGSANTKALYEFAGLSEVADIMDQLSTLNNINVQTTGTGSLDLIDYAAEDCAMLNKFTKETQSDSEGKNDIAKISSYSWFLPAKDEVAEITDATYNLSGDYWTSSAATSTDDPESYSSKAWKYTYGSSISYKLDIRGNQNKVRCIRKKQ